MRPVLKTGFAVLARAAGLAVLVARIGLAELVARTGLAVLVARTGLEVFARTGLARTGLAANFRLGLAFFMVRTVGGAAGGLRNFATDGDAVLFKVLGEK